jgi:hypothetical protein
MTKIKDVTIEFNCPETLDSKLHCDRCSHAVIDFTNKTDKELIEEIKKSKGPVCGLFKKSQLSSYFGDTVPRVSVIPCHFLRVQKY